MSRGKWIAVAIAALIVALIVWRVLNRAPASDLDQSNAPVPVTVVPVATENVPVYLTSQGTVQALNTVTVLPQVGGKLLKLDFTEGQPVKKGQVLAKIDPGTYQAQYDQAVAKKEQDEAQLATAMANLARSDSPQYKQYVAQINRITQANNVKQLKAAVAADDAAIRDAQVQLGYTKVLSPIDGLAGIRQVDPGNVLTTSSSIVVITQTRPINVLFTLAGKYLDEVRMAQVKAPLNVAILDANGNVVENDGVLKVIDNQIDPSTGSFKLKAEFPNPDNRLFPGQYVSTRLQVSVDSNALVVPAAAVQRGPNGDFVWLITGKRPAGASDQNNDTAGASNGRGSRHERAQGARSGQDANAGKLRYVTMQPVVQGGEAGDSGVIISSSLKAGDLVVTAGQFRLKQGSAVLPLKPGEVPAPPTSAQIKAAAQQAGRSGPRGG